jgi:hypothetical protein
MAAYNRSLKRYSTRLLLLQQISSKPPALVAVLSTRQRATGSAFPHPHIPHIPLFRLLYQVEIRRYQFPHRKSLARSQLLPLATVKRDCGNCGVVT